MSSEDYTATADCWLACTNAQTVKRLSCVQGSVSYYCLDRTAGNGSTPNSCSEPTSAQIAELTSSMAACFKSATDAGFDIAISPHLDDGLGFGKLPSAAVEAATRPSLTGS